MSDHLELGREGERLALQYLQKQGYDILARNFQGRGGEIDLIAYDGDLLVFIEVKTRATLEFGQPIDAVDAEKRRGLRQAADDFRSSYALEARSYRFDIVSIIVTERGPRISLHRNAF